MVPQLFIAELINIIMPLEPKSLEFGSAFKSQSGGKFLFVTNLFLDISGCHICGEMDHKRRDCPNKNSQTLTKSVKQRWVLSMKNGCRECKVGC